MTRRLPPAAPDLRIRSIRPGRALPRFAAFLAAGARLVLPVSILGSAAAAPGRAARSEPGLELRANAPAPMPAGVFEMTPKARNQWGWSGAWRYPVGDPRDFAAPGESKGPAFRLLRGQAPGADSTRRHDGADLGCGRSGIPVRAAAGGLVLRADRTGWNSGYGLYVVVGHRLPQGGQVYSIYAHLAEGSIVVRPGQTVAAGQRLGRVGRTGRATTPHLHFEIRRSGGFGERWENETVEDPLEFVSARLAGPSPADTLGRYVDWAKYAGLLPAEADLDAPLRPELWWHMLAVSARHDLDALPSDPEALAESLVAAGVLPEKPPPSVKQPLEWRQIARDLERIRLLGQRLPVRPFTDPAHRRTCEAWLGTREPARALDKSVRLEKAPPTVYGALLAIADVAPPLVPAKPGPKKKKPARPATPLADSSAVAAKAGASSSGPAVRRDSAAAAKGKVTPVPKSRPTGGN